MPVDLLWTAYDVAEVVVPLAMLPVVARQHEAPVALGWLVLIVFLPLLGSAAYAYVGWFRVRQNRVHYARTAELLADHETAAMLGVRVDLIAPCESGQAVVDAAARACFDRLLEAGVRVHLHEGGVLHAKSLSVDDRFALVGSANLDQRSFHLDAEIGVLVLDAAFARDVRHAQERLLADSVEVEPEAWARRSVVRAGLDHSAKLLSPLL